MIKDMDSADKTFFSNMFTKIENHQIKTCDELKEVDKKVVALQTSFSNHIEYSQRDEDKEIAKKMNKPQWVLVILGIGTLGVGIAMSAMALI